MGKKLLKTIIILDSLLSLPSISLSTESTDKDIHKFESNTPQAKNRFGGCPSGNQKPSSSDLKECPTTPSVSSYIR